MRSKRKTMFIHTKQLSITSFNLKKYLFCRISDESALIRNFLRNGRVRGKPIGRVRVNQSRHERSRHRLGMGWTNVLPAGKQRCAGNEKFSGISNPIRNGPFCEFPGIVGIGMKNFKTSIIPEISHTPGMGMKFFGNPEKKIFVFSSMSKFDFFTMNRFIRSFYHSLW